MQHTACPGATCSMQRRRDRQAVKTQQISLDSFSAMATLANWVETVRETWSKAETLLDEKPEEIDLQVMLANLSNLEIRQLKSGHHIFTGTRLAASHLPRDSAHPCHICTGTGLTFCHICTGTGLTSCQSAQLRPGLVHHALAMRLRVSWNKQVGTGEWERAKALVSGNGPRLLPCARSVKPQSCRRSLGAVLSCPCCTARCIAAARTGSYRAKKPNMTLTISAHRRIRRTRHEPSGPASLCPTVSTRNGSAVNSVLLCDRPSSPLQPPLLGCAAGRTVQYLCCCWTLIPLARMDPM